MADRHPADSRDLRNTGTAPTHARIVQVLDVLITTTGRSHEVDDADFDAHPPVTERGPLDLGHGLRIDRLAGNDAELVMNASMPRGHFFFPTRQYGQRYAYIYEPARAAWQENRYSWDPEGRVNAALQLSRLVHDNSDSMEYAARLFIHEDGERQVVPRHDCELGRAYSLHLGRDWLDAPEAAALKHLLDSYWAAADKLPDRVRRALRRTAHLPTERYVDDRLAETAIALESLVNAGRARASRQFMERVTALGTELQVPGVSRSWCRKMYHARSHGLHGADVALLSDEGPPRTQAIEYVARLEEVLRRAVRCCLEDPTFRTHFDSEATVMAWCPVPEPAPGWRARLRRFLGGGH